MSASPPATSEPGSAPCRTFKDKLYRLIACGMSTFQVYTAIVAPFTAMIQRPIHLAFGLTLIFMKKKSGDSILNKLLDIILSVLGAAVGLYWVFNMTELSARVATPTNLDLAMSLIAVLVVLEATRRTIGWALPLISIAFLLYAHFGSYLPAIIGHKGYTWSRIISYCYTFPEGIFGSPLGVSATYIYLFVMLACVMQRTGMGDVFIRLALAATGRFVGGPAKAAVLASCMFGCVSGSCAANVVATGTFTIPLMKKAGYPNNFAGAVEAAASAGGQLMPPMMGAAAFIIADFLGVSYFNVLTAAFFPAILYFLSVGSVIHYTSLRDNICPPRTDQKETVWQVLRSDGYHLLPLVVLITMLAMDLSPLRSGMTAIVVTVVLNLFFGKNKMRFKDFVELFEDSGTRSFEVVTATACAGIIVGMVSLTGIGLKLSNVIINLSGDSLMLVLVLSMLASIVLGMGLPTTACYIILAVITVPTVVKMGVVPMAAHLFVFYFGILSTITPPVAISAYIGASLADGNPMQTGWKAVQLAAAGFLVPFLFIYSPALIFEGSLPEILFAIVTGLVGIATLSVSTVGYYHFRITILERIILFFVAIGMVGTHILTNIVCIAILIGLYVIRVLIINRRQPSLASPQDQDKALKESVHDH